jgi:DNA-directed RNA polymerase specialized sigma24 family protein
MIFRLIYLSPDLIQSHCLTVECGSLSCGDAATVPGVPTGTITSRMKRGRALLHKALWQPAKDRGLKQV